MPYSQYSLGDLSSQLATLLDDPNERYWSQTEKFYAIWEGLRVWGAITSYWRTRGSFAVSPATTWYDLSAELPALRTRAWTLNKLTQEIQYMCLEAANGISGAGMSGQISVDSILRSIQRARNQFVIDARFPYSVNTSPVSPPPPDGMVSFSQTSVYVHRTGWMDSYSGTWTNLWRSDAWAIDRADPTWTLEPGAPKMYSESENAPLKLQIAPAPQNPGKVETITVDSLLIDITNPNATFHIPDEWVHAIKYAALADIFSAESQNKDDLRAQYAQMRYDQAMQFAMSAKSILRVLLNGVPLPLTPMASIDSGLPFWRNQADRPQMAGAFYDMLMLAPMPDNTYGVTCDVTQTAPIPLLPNQFIPMGAEDIPHLIDYVTHVLTFKCGGQEFKDSFAQYDAFLKEAGARGQINMAKIRYLKSLFEQPWTEQAERPDRLEAARA